MAEIGHTPQLEAPEKVNRLIRDFIEARQELNEVKAFWLRFIGLRVNAYFYFV